MHLSESDRRALSITLWTREYLRHVGRTPAGQLLWSEDEVAILQSCRNDRRGLESALAPRTPKAIQRKLAKLGLLKPRGLWASDQVQRFKLPYRAGAPVGDIALEVEKTKHQVWNKACQIRIRRPRRPPKETGFLVVDRIRRRAFELRLSMNDLDALAQTRRYFRDPRHLNWTYIGRALKVLGGRMTASWPDH